MNFNDANDLISKVLPAMVRRQICNVFDTALKAYNGFVQKNSDFFEFLGSGNLNSRIFSYAIDRQFMKEVKNPDFLFVSEYRKVNNFNQKAIYLFKDNVILNIAKTKESNNMPGVSKYRLINAKNNRFFNRQLLFNFDDLESHELIEPPYYCLITYGIQLDELTHLNIIVPDEDIKGFYANVDILHEFALIDFSDDKFKEAKVATLKNDISTSDIVNKIIINK